MKLGANSKGQSHTNLSFFFFFFFCIKPTMCLALPHRPLGGQGPVYCSKVAFLGSQKLVYLHSLAGANRSSPYSLESRSVCEGRGYNSESKETKTKTFERDCFQI